MASSFLKQKARERAEKLEKEYGPTAYGGTTWLNEQINGEKKKKKDDDIAPVRTTTTKEDDRKWFEKGAFEDGYQFGDVFKTLLGTGQDLHENLFEGAYGIAEKTVDAGAYLVGGAAGLMGADKFRDKTEAFIEKDLIDEERWAKFAAGTTMPGVITKILSGGKDTDEMSVLGEKTDSLVQSGGQLGATIGLQAVGVPWWVTSGVTGFGGEAESALKEGATYGEAGLSAAITAGAEILTEKISGGIKFGGATLDDVLTKRIARGVSNKVVRTLMKFGMDATGEGLEEVLSGVMSAVGQRITYADDKELTELFSKEEAWESFIGGAVLGGGSSGVNAVKSKGYGVDPVSNLTTNEQKVVDQEYKNRVSEAEKKGKVTQKQKDAIYDEVIRDMERGFISTDTIEEVLGGETYKTHKDTIESEKAMQEEYDTLYQMKNGDKSDAQIDRQAELKQKLEDIKQNFNRNQLQDEVMSMVKGDRLAESYNERSRRGQAFEADISKYDAKQQATIQKAIDSGILNNTNRTHEFVDLVAKIAADKGVPFDFTNNERLKNSGFALNGKTVNGYVTKDGVTLNIESAKALNSVVGHEVTHVLEGTEMYTALQSAVTEYAKTKGEYQSRYDSLAKLYEGIEGADIDAELTADLVGDYLFADAEFVKHLSVNHRNVFQRIFDEIKYLCKVATAGSKELRELEKVKKLFEEAYRAETKNTVVENGVQYSLGRIEDVTPSQEQRELNVQKVASMKPVYKVDAAKLVPGEKSIKEIYQEYFTLWGENIHSKIFGDIAVKNSSIRSDMRHGSTPVKIASIEAIPSVIQQGEIIEWIDKGHGVLRIVVAAPIDIGKTSYYMGVMLQRDSQHQRLYIHDVIVKKEASDPTEEHLDSTGSYDENENLFLSSILDRIVEVKQNGVEYQNAVTSGDDNVVAPTADPDIQRSLSNEDEDIAPVGNYNVYGKDIALETAPTKDTAPVREAETAEAMFPDDLAQSFDNEPEITKRESAIKRGIEYYQSIIRGEAVNTFDKSENVLASAISKMEELLSNEDSLQSMTSEDFDAFMRRMGLFSWNREAKVEKTVDAPIKTTKERLETKLSNRQTELSNIEKLRADSNKSYDEKIAKAQAELDSKKNKDSKVANNLRKRIERLQRLKADIDAGYAKRINDINKSIDKTSAELEKDHTEKDRYARAVNRINAVLEHDKAELQAEYAKRKADMESRTADKNSYTSQMAKELYDEIRNLKKGVRASDALASLLDAGYDWGNIKSALTNVRYNPAETVNPNSDTEAAVRQLINESYEEDVYSIDDLDVELAEEINKLDTKAEEDRKKARTATQRRVKSEEYNKLWKYLIGDTSTWEDMPFGLSYKTKTLRRILRKVVKDANGNPDYHKADIIYDELETKYDHNEALLKRESQKLKDIFHKLNLNHVEDTYAHMLGELRYNAETELTEDKVKEYYDKHKGRIDTGKVDKAITEARKVFDDLILRVNEVLKEQGFKEIPYRKGYFPHFTNPKRGLLAKLLNWKPINTEIPTSIAGLTETFKPQRSWQSFDKQRHGDTTDYSLYQGLDTYIHGALDWIYHIEDIQKRRALENHLRTIHSDEGVTQRIQEIKDGNYDADEAQQMIDAVLSKANNPLSGLVRELMNRTNTLANKKAAADRAKEDDTNRKVYSTMTNLNNRITSNMVVGSISSALTNFIPIVQSWHQVSPVYTVRGLGDFVRSAVRDDGMVERSDFLTNRLIEEENLYKTGWDKVSDKAAFMMSAFDKITSQTVWRSKYLQNIHEGMSEAMAIKDADQFAKNLMAGRSRGNAPTIFDAKNPITKLFTAFQLEVANQYGYMFDDVVKDSTSKARLVKGYATAFVGAYVYNALYSALVGRDAAFDPISIIEDLLGDLFDDEEEPEDIILNFTENVLQEVPYVGGLLGGGRVPISSALPYSNVSNPFESMLSDLSEGNLDSVGKEMLKPLYYLAMPVGGGQIKKTVEGLSMFSDDHPIAGSYTKSGDLRFPVEDTFGNRVKAGLFGQYASKNAREYFDNGYAPLKEKQIREFIDLDIPIRDYWEYREGLRGLSKLGEKADYIADLDLPIAKKNLLINNIADRKEDIDLEGYDDFGDFEEFDFAVHNPEKYEIAKAVGGYDAYVKYQDGMKDMKLAEKVDYVAGLNLTDAQKNALINGETDRKEPIDLTGYNTSDYSSFEEFEFAKENPGRYGVAKVVGGYEDYTGFMEAIGDFDSKDANGKTVSGLKKERVTAYINGLDLDYGQKIILYRSLYDSKADRATYDSEIFNYLLSRDDLSYEEKVEILKKLGFSVSADGYVTW